MRQVLQRQIKESRQQADTARAGLVEVQEQFSHVAAELEVIQRTVRPTERVRIDNLTKDIQIACQKTGAIQSDLSSCIRKYDSILQKIRSLPSQELKQ